MHRVHREQYQVRPLVAVHSSDPGDWGRYRAPHCPHSPLKKIGQRNIFKVLAIVALPPTIVLSLLFEEIRLLPMS
jgi:hypothetical protein